MDSSKTQIRDEKKRERKEGKTEKEEGKEGGRVGRRKGGRERLHLMKINTTSLSRPPLDLLFLSTVFYPSSLLSLSQPGKPLSPQPVGNHQDLENYRAFDFKCFQCSVL